VPRVGVIEIVISGGAGRGGGGEEEERGGAARGEGERGNACLQDKSDCPAKLARRHPGVTKRDRDVTAVRY